jgi:hypothetical protein
MILSVLILTSTLANCSLSCRQLNPVCRERTCSIISDIGVSKAASRVGDVVKQIVEGASPTDVQQSL